MALPAADRDVLLATVDAWVANAGSAKRTAGQLYCHPNTVRYRLQRVQNELRMSLTDPNAVAQLVVALRAWRMLGDASTPDHVRLSIPKLTVEPITAGTNRKINASALNPPLISSGTVCRRA